MKNTGKSGRIICSVTQHTPWRNEELRSSEEGLQQQKERYERVAMRYKATTGVGCDGFHPHGSQRFAERNEK